MKNILIIDTNPILNCPRIITMAINSYEKVIIPSVVIEEINYQKDYGNQGNRRNAGICLGLLADNRDKYCRIKTKDYGRHDDRIYRLAEKTAIENKNLTVHLLTNDKDFALKGYRNITNLFIITSNKFMDLLSNSEKYDMNKTIKFFNFVKENKIESIKTLDLENININYIDGETGYTPLIQAVINHNYGIVNYLVNLSGIELNKVDEKLFRLPALSHAIQKHDLKMVKLLIHSGANVNAPSKNATNYYNTPLMIAAWCGDYKAVKILIKNGSCINQQDKKNGFTALIKAAFNNYSEIVEFLLNSGADKTIYSFESKTALDYAIEKNDNGNNNKTIQVLREN